MFSAILVPDKGSFVHNNTNDRWAYGGACVFQLTVATCHLHPARDTHQREERGQDTCVTGPPSGEDKDMGTAGFGWICLAGRRDSPPQHDQRGREISLKAKCHVALTLNARFCDTTAVATFNVQFVFVSLGEFWQT